MKTLIITLICVFSTVSTQASSEQIPDIEKYISGRREAIETNYSDRLIELRLRAQSNIRLLEVAEQPKPDCVRLDEWADYVEAVLQMNGLGKEACGRFETFTLSPAERLAAALSTIAGRKNDILADLEWRVVKLERQRKYALTAGLERLRLRLKASQLQTKPETTRGVIAGIIFTEDNPILIIDGTAVRNNETIHGVNIVKIHEDMVEFEKNGKSWTQRIRETREDNWR